ncbi:MAG: protein TolQ [Gammaproteobacteria bacterium]|nr:protein TolQ [Gammaproteobacteria bacterium]MCP5200638.1 protein TolQ [Gammaproteobacteria bacterium]
MHNDLSIASLVLGASLLVKLIMLILLLASIASWALIFTKRRQVRQAQQEMEAFEDEFWSTEDLTRLYNRISASAEDATAMERIFEAGFREFARLRKRGGLEAMDILDGAQRAMKVSVSRELEALEAGLPNLATVGSVSPYVGLFGTVWGIMNSFQALGNVHQATLAMVAPGISEALVATAMGLFAAIPAVIGYNRNASAIDRILGRYDIFVEEFISILRRQVHD